MDVGLLSTRCSDLFFCSSNLSQFSRVLGRPANPTVPRLRCQPSLVQIRSTQQCSCRQPGTTLAVAAPAPLTGGWTNERLCANSRAGHRGVGRLVKHSKAFSALWVDPSVDSDRCSPETSVGARHQGLCPLLLQLVRRPELTGFFDPSRDLALSSLPQPCYRCLDVYPPPLWSRAVHQCKRARPCQPATRAPPAMARAPPSPIPSRCRHAHGVVHPTYQRCSLDQVETRCADEAGGAGEVT